MFLTPVNTSYQNQNGLTYDSSAKFDLNHMNGLFEKDQTYSLIDMNGFTFVNSVQFSYPGFVRSN